MRYTIWSLKGKVTGVHDVYIPLHIGVLRMFALEDFLDIRHALERNSSCPGSNSQVD